MKKLLLSCLITFVCVGAEAQLRCQDVHRPVEAKEWLNSLNEKYDKILFEISLEENIEQSFLPIKKYRLFQLRRMLKDLNKNGSRFDSYELEDFVYRLDKLAFNRKSNENADLENKLTAKDKQILSDVRRALLADGIVKTFGLESKKSGMWRKFYGHFSKAFSWRYLRWLSPLKLQKMVGIALPLELAQKIAWEGIDAHRGEIEKYLPKIRTRAVFNQFSKAYNVLVLSALLAVVPYLTYDFHQESMAQGQAVASQSLEGLVQISGELAKVDQLMEKELGALEKYKVGFARTYQREPTALELQEAQNSIHDKIMRNLKMGPPGQSGS